MRVGGDELQPARLVALGKRHLQGGGGAERGGDPLARPRLLFRLRERRDFLGGAAKDHRVAALQPHYALALGGKRVHQGNDAILLAGWLVAAFADRDFFRLRRAISMMAGATRSS